MLVCISLVCSSEESKKPKLSLENQATATLLCFGGLQKPAYRAESDTQAQREHARDQAWALGQTHVAVDIFCWMSLAL